MNGRTGTSFVFRSSVHDHDLSYQRPDAPPPPKEPPPPPEEWLELLEYEREEPELEEPPPE